MVSHKAIVILLIIAVVLSVISIVITFSINIERNISAQPEPDTAGGQIGFTLIKSPEQRGEAG